MVIPGTTVHFEVGRKKSIEAVEAAMSRNQLIFLIAQKDASIEDPSGDELCRVGTVSRIKQTLKLPGDNLRVLVEGISRAIVTGSIQSEPYHIVEVEGIQVTVRDADGTKTEAFLRSAREAFRTYSSCVSKLPAEISIEAEKIDDPGRFADYVISNIFINPADKQRILDELNPYDRLELLICILEREIEILKTESDIQSRVKEQLDQNQKEYYLREQLKIISEELGETEDDSEDDEEYLLRINNLNIDEEYKEKLAKEVHRLMKMPFGMQEAAVIRTYLDTVLDLPWNVSTKTHATLKSVAATLNRNHYGLDKIKDRILEYMAAKLYAPGVNGQIICLVGPPGVGKSSIAKSIASALHRKYARISLGGVRDEADIRGHRRTYVASMPGRIISAIIQAGANNPVILLDEIDKLGNDFRGDPSSALLEVLDREQNHAFRDHYIEIPFDLSDTLFITTANTIDGIPEPLLDRMDVIQLPSYTREEKLQIAKRHLIVNQMKQHGLKKTQLRIPDKSLLLLIDSYTREAGVRNLDRLIASVCRKTVKKFLTDSSDSLVLTEQVISQFFGPKKYKPESLGKTDEIGVVNGLAWTSVGGECLTVEVSTMEGAGKLELTGSLGDVMKESARAAVSYIRSRADMLHIDKEFYKNRDIHIHFPEGAIPKDGPSAGITIAVALISELASIPVCCDVAMTGEITLRGRVLPIGGLKEKAMAAYRAGLRRVIIPADNEPDLYEIDETVRRALQFIPVSNMDQVIQHALRYMPGSAAQKAGTSPALVSAGAAIKAPDIVPAVTPGGSPAVIQVPAVSPTV